MYFWTDVAALHYSIRVLQAWLKVGFHVLKPSPLGKKREKLVALTETHIL